MDLLPMTISLAVPIWIAKIKKAGGPTPAEWEAAYAAGEELALKGNILWERCDKKGEVAKLFNSLAQALAVLAFMEGGIEMFGCHWDASLPAFMRPPDPSTASQSSQPQQSPISHPTTIQQDVNSSLGKEVERGTNYEPER